MKHTNFRHPSFFHIANEFGRTFPLLYWTLARPAINKKKQMSSSWLSEIWWVKAKQLMCSKFWVILDVNPMWICMIPWSNGLHCKAWEVAAPLWETGESSTSARTSRKRSTTQHTLSNHIPQSSSHWVNGISSKSWTKSCISGSEFWFYPVIQKVFLYIPGGAGFCPSASHQSELLGWEVSRLLALGLGVSSLGIFEKSFEGKISHEFISDLL